MITKGWKTKQKRRIKPEAIKDGEDSLGKIETIYNT